MAKTNVPFAIGLCSTVESRETGSIQWTADPATVYPAIIARIREALTLSTPPDELLYASDAPCLKGRRPYELADAWVKEAQYVRGDAWEDALRPRDALPALPFPLGVNTVTTLGTRMFQDVKRKGDGNLKLEYFPDAWQPLASSLTADAWAALERVAWRAFALDFALGWFHEALRVASPTNRTFGQMTRDEAFRLA